MHGGSPGRRVGTVLAGVQEMGTVRRERVGLGLWVSFYEPPILFALVLLLRAAVQPKGLWSRAARAEWMALGVVLVVGFLCERSLPIAWPDDTVRELFPRWKQSIGELGSVTPFSPLPYRWVGFGLLASPILMGFAARKDRRAIPVLALLLIVWGLSLWQIRWGYFLALVFVMSIPLQATGVPKLWPVWIGFVISLWPVAADWEDRLFPSLERQAQLAEQRADNVFLREVANFMKPDPGGVLAPWWLSPSLAYWSGLPCVAGSSHESLPGTAAASRFYLTASVEEARRILEQRKVRWVVAYEPSRVLQTSASLIGRNPGTAPMATLLYERPGSAPPFLQLAYSNQFFKVFRVHDAISRQ